MVQKLANTTFADFFELFVTKSRQKIKDIVTNSNYNRAALQQIKAHEAIDCSVWQPPENQE